MSEIHDPASGSRASASGIDVLSDVLRSVRLTGTMLFRVDARRPWRSWAPNTEAFRRALLPASQHIVSFHVVTRGGCWAGLPDAAPERFERGDVLVIPHGDAYFLADPFDAPPLYDADEAVAFLRGMAAGELPPAVAEGARGAAQTQFLCGFLGCDRRPFNPALAALPRMVHLRACNPPGERRMHHLIEFALAELRDRACGSRVVLLRLAELTFVEAVRRHLASPGASQTGWLAGLNDPVVGRSLALLHADPARDWSLGALAAQIGTSRSVLAERFTRFVGQPPMQYLTRWRLQRASHLLIEPRAKVAAVAAAVGYDSEAAFSRAFKKHAGQSPALWRRDRLGRVSS